MSTSVNGQAPPTAGLSRQELREIAVGAACFVLFVVVLLLSYTGAPMARDAANPAYRVFATFNRVDGLRVGDDVQVAGVPIGEVEAMTLLPNHRVKVTFRVADDVPLPTDTSAAIQTDGLFGSKFVVLEPGGDEQLLKDGGSILYTQDSLVVSELLDLIIAEGRAQRASSAESQTAAPEGPQP